MINNEFWKRTTFRKYLTFGTYRIDSTAADNEAKVEMSAPEPDAQYRPSGFFRDRGAGKVLHIVGGVLLLIGIAIGIVGLFQHPIGAHYEVVGVVESSAYMGPSRGTKFSRAIATVRLPNGDLAWASLASGIAPPAPGAHVKLRAYTQTFGQPRYTIISAQQ